MTARPPLLQAIVPPFSQFSAQTFDYPKLEKTVKEFYGKQYQELTDKHALFSIESADHASLVDYFPAVSLKIQQAKTTSEQKLWSALFTQLSVAVFGAPQLERAVQVAKKDLVVFSRIIDTHPELPADRIQPVIETYRAFIERNDDGNSTESDWSDAGLLAQLKAYLYTKYDAVYKQIDRHYEEDDSMNVAQIVESYERMLDVLRTFSDDWSGWRVVLSEGAQMAVSPGARKIKIGSRMPNLPARRAKSLFTHEVLVHAQRAVRGLAYDRRLGYGLPGYLTAEEGLGVLMEAAIAGKMPYRAGDRYVDIMLALGSPGMPALNRHELLPIVHGRTLLRNAKEAIRTTEAQLKDMTQQHVVRIYRGTLGNEIIGVFTKDVVYYEGYHLMTDYLKRYQHRDLRRAVDFVLSSKINPDDPLHRSYVHDQKFNVRREQ